MVNTIRYIKSSFNLPDIIDRFIQGKNTGLYHEPGLPNITAAFKLGFLGDDGLYDGNASGQSFTYEQIGSRSGSWGHDGNYARRWQCNFNATRSDPIYGNSTTVQPKSIELSFYIKF